jgi:predicted dehydrogenase
MKNSLSCKTEATSGLSRRGFLKNSILAVTAGVAFPTFVSARALGRDGGVAPSNRINVGCIGLQQGWNDGFSGCRQQRGVEAVALCDVDRGRLDDRLGQLRRSHNGKSAKGYVDFREMFEKANLDACVIAPPDHWHAIMCIAAARKGIDIYGEKPLSHKLREGRAIVNAVKQHGRIWQTGSWQRSRSNFHRGVELVRNGRIGKLIKMEVGTHDGGGKRNRESTPGTVPPGLDYDLYVGPAQWHDYDQRVVHYHWRWTSHFGGGQLMDWVGHHVDIAHWGAGKDDTGPVKVEPIDVEYLDGIYDTEKKYTYRCTYADGLEMVVNSQSGTKFIGEKGWIYVNRSGRGRQGLEASDPKILEEIIGENEYHPYKCTNHTQNFIECIRSRAETITPVETAHRSASVGHLGKIALQLGRTLHWDPVSETIKDDDAANALLSPQYRKGWSL